MKDLLKAQEQDIVATIKVAVGGSIAVVLGEYTDKVDRAVEHGAKIAAGRIIADLTPVTEQATDSQLTVGEWGALIGELAEQVRRGKQRGGFIALSHDLGDKILAALRTQGEQGEPHPLAVCEANRIILRVGHVYRVYAQPGCAECQRLASEYNPSEWSCCASTTPTQEQTDG